MAFPFTKSCPPLISTFLKPTFWWITSTIVPFLSFKRKQIWYKFGISALHFLGLFTAKSKVCFSLKAEITFEAIILSSSFN